MKRFLLLSILSTTILMAHAQEITLKLASDVWPPFTDKEEQTAVAVDLVKEALNRNGIQLDLQILDFDEVMNGIYNDEYDGSAALWKDNEREEQLLFSDPYIYNQLVLVGKKGSDVSATSFDELKNIRLGIVGAYSYGDLFESRTDLRFVDGKNDQESMNKLLNGEVDYILVDKLLIQYLMENQKDEATKYLEIGKTSLIKKPLHFAIRKDYPDAENIIKNFNRELILMAADGSYNRILHLNWIHADIDGDGNMELVLNGTQAGKTPPTSNYSIFESGPTKSNQSSKYYVEGKVYEDWDNIPQEYKVPQVKESDLSKIGLMSFSF